MSSDRSQADMMDYMRNTHADWLAIPFGIPAVQALSSHFGVRGIPALVVVGRDGSIISQEGRQEVMSLGEIIVYSLKESQRSFMLRSGCFCSVGDVGACRGGHINS